MIKLNWRPTSAQHRDTGKQETALPSHGYLQLEMPTHKENTGTLTGSPVLLCFTPGACRGNLNHGFRNWVDFHGSRITNVDDVMSRYYKVNMCGGVFDVVFTPSNTQ